MATRQYIGARYTPKFSGTYDSTQAYEALEVVDNGSGTTYIARKPVPPNTPLTNTEYWLVYGSSSGAVLDLQERMSNAESDITVINSSILRMGGEISSAEEDIDSLESDVTSIKKDKYRKYVFIGDSYGHGSGSNNGWIDKLVTKLGLSSSDYFDSAVGGAGFGTITNSFGSLLETLSASMTGSQRNSITDIVVLGGANDYGIDVPDMKGYINAFVASANNDFPYAKIHIGMCAGNTANNFLAVHSGRVLDGYLSGSGYSYINNVEYVLHDNRLVQSDNVHPTNEGYERLANFVYAYLTGGSYSVGMREQTSFTISGGTIDIAGKCMSVIEDGVANCSAQFISVTFTNVKDFQRHVSIDTGLNTNSHIFRGMTTRTGIDYNLAHCNSHFEMHSTHTNEWYNIEGIVEIINGEVWVTNMTRVSSEVDVALRYVDKLVISEFNITIPSIYC